MSCLSQTHDVWSLTRDSETLRATAGPELIHSHVSLWMGISVPPPAFGDLCPRIPRCGSTLLHCSNSPSLLQKHVCLRNMRFALSIGQDWRRGCSSLNHTRLQLLTLLLPGSRRKTARCRPPTLCLQLSNGTVTLLPSIPGGWGCPWLWPWNEEVYRGVKMECGDWQYLQGEPSLGWEATPSTEEAGRLLYVIYEFICSW